MNLDLTHSVRGKLLLQVCSFIISSFLSYQVVAQCSLYPSGNQSTCDPEQVMTLVVTSVPGGGTHYWSGSGGSAPYVLQSNQYNHVTAVDVVGNSASYTVTASCGGSPVQITATYTPVNAYSVTGGGAYCSGGSGKSVGLSDSQSGVAYYLKRNGSNVGSPVNGTGSAISFGNQTTAGTYTVEAIKSGCSVVQMNGSVNVTVNSLPTLYTVTGGGEYCQDESGPAVGLSDSQSGTTYQLKRNGSNVSSLSGTGSAISFGSQYTAGTYTVVATKSGCTRTMSGSVSVVQNPLPFPYSVTGGGDICTGESVNISLSDSETGVSYQLKRGGSNVGSAKSGTGSSISFGSHSTLGTYTIVGTISSTGCDLGMGNSVSITAGSVPTAYNMTGGGSYCSGGGGLPLGLNDSQSGVTYQLMRGASTIGSSVSGTGSAISFGTHTTGGTYYVEATKTSSGCIAYMNTQATITVDPLPTSYSVTGGGSYCLGGSGVSIGLSDTQGSGFEYQLKRNGSNTGSPVTGTGGSISFGNQTSSGTYTVVATNTSTGCVKTMSGSKSVTVNVLPTVYSVTGGGSYCSGGSGVTVGLSDSQSGINYQLKRNGSNTGSPVSGTGNAISFGNQTSAGTYTVEATNASTSCSRTMSGSKSVTVKSLPTLYTVTGGGEYCQDESGPVVGLSDSQSGVSYQLKRNGSNVSSLSGTGSAISFGSQYTAGTYTVVATKSGCTRTMSGSVSVVQNPLPFPYSVTGGGDICTGESVNISLSDSETGVSYQLKRGGSNVGSAKSGTGSSISFGSHSTLGTYTIVGTISSTGCDLGMGNSVSITAGSVPTAYNMTGGGSYCSGGGGLPLGLNDSQSGVTYQLMRGASTIGSSVSGTGSAISFGTHTTGGTYYVEATKTSSGCIAYMNTQATITVDPLPTSYSVTGGGSYCLGGSGVSIGLSDTQGSGFEYQLKRNGSNTGSPVTGTGGSISFGNQTSSGTYTVVATNTSTGCVKTMSGSKSVTVNVLPTLYSMTGESSYCSGSGGSVLGLNDSQSGVEYQLVRNGSTNVGSPVNGTGNPISFPAQTQAATYTVEATNTTTNCSRDMTGSINLTIDPLPQQFNVTGGGIYCIAGALPVGLDGSETGVTYQLKLGGNDVSGASISGTGSAINFSDQAATGEYTVVAINDNTGCVRSMSGSADIGLGTTPNQYSIGNTGDYCIASGSGGIQITMSSSESDVSYRLERDNVIISTEQGGGSVDFGSYNQPGEYTVSGLRGLNCTADMNGSITIQVFEKYNVITDTTYCAGSTGALIGLDGSQSGVTYTLMQGTTIIDDVLGTGNSISFGQHPENSYYVLASDGTLIYPSGCYISMDGGANTVEVQEVDNPQNVTINNITTTSASISWDPVNGADQYKINVAKDPLFNNIVNPYEDYLITSTSINISGLGQDTLYYFQVLAQNECFESFYITRTVYLLPSVPDVTIDSVIGDNNFIVHWNKVHGNSYELEVSADGAFGSFVGPYNPLLISIGNTWSVDTLIEPGTVYYVRMRSVNPSGTSGYSNTDTVLTLPGRPDGYATNVTETSFTANWNNIQSATHYLLNVYKVSNGTSSKVSGYDDLQVTGTSQAVSGLSGGDFYYFKVNAVNATGEGLNSKMVVVGLPYSNAPPSPEQNYVRTEMALAPITDETEFIKAGRLNKLTSFAYSDGLGRSSQDVVILGSPGFKDIVQVYEYDTIGSRQHKEYLPITVDSDTAGTFRSITNPLQTVQNFYDGTNTIPDDNYPYALTTVDTIGRVKTKTGPGEVWHTAAGVKGKSTFNHYISDGTENIVKWGIKNGKPDSLGVYGANSLMIDEVISPDSVVSQKLTDSRGRNIANRTWDDQQQKWIISYQIYNDLNLLRFMIPPKAAQVVDLENNQAAIDGLCFEYRYDERKRKIWSKMPGAAPVVSVYDQWDRLVASQDANQKINNNWTYFKYDNFNRVIISGVESYNISHANLQAEVMAETNRYETADNSAIGYTTNQTWPTTPDNIYTVNYYGNYSFLDNTGWTAGAYDFSANALVGTSDLDTAVLGLSTGSRVKNFEDDSWLNTVIYYDDEYEMLQTISENHIGGKDILSQQLDWQGNVTALQVQHFGLDTVTLLTTHEYDKDGRLQKTYNKIDDQDSIEVANYVYNELGDLIRKNLGVFDMDTLQSVDYLYNIRGALLSINDSDLSDPNDLFGMNYHYTNSNVTVGGNDITPRYDGSITALEWQSDNLKTNDFQKSIYGYAYDGRSQLKSAMYANANGSNWTTNAGHFDVGVGYQDDNGNIGSLFRRSKGTTIDSLQYGYSDFTNRLDSVTDHTDSIAGFSNYNGATEIDISGEYEFDTLGNLTADLNKGVFIQYNEFLNLPERIDFSYDGSNVYMSIVYTYDAAGNKLSKAVLDGSETELARVDYVGIVEYADDHIWQVMTDGGRAIPKEDEYFYEFMLQDHQGNSRVTFGMLPFYEEYVATMESELDSIESEQFVIDDNCRSTDFNHTPGGNESAKLNAAKVQGQPGPVVGPAKPIEIKAGDKISMEVWARYEEASNGGPQVTADVLAGILATFGLTSTVGAGEGFDILYGNGSSGAVQLFSPDSNPNDRFDEPDAYLQYVFFDTSYTAVTAGYAGMTMNGFEAFEKLVINDLTFQEDGFLYVYLVNETLEDQDVYFDDLKIIHESPETSLRVTQVNDYYPFGMLTASSWQAPGYGTSGMYFQANYAKYDSLLGQYDFLARSYDPALGRFVAVDPAGQFGSPYLGMGNSPVMYVDPTGEVAWFVPIIIGAALGGFGGYQAGKAAGASGFWEWVGYIGGGAAIGGAAGFAAVGTSALVGGTTLAGATSAGFGATVVGGIAGGAVNGAGMAALTGGNIGEGAWKGGLIGLASAGVGGAIANTGHTGLGAFTGGAAGGATSGALHDGNILQSALLGGSFSYGMYLATTPKDFRQLSATERKGIMQTHKDRQDDVEIRNLYNENGDRLNPIANYPGESNSVPSDQLVFENGQWSYRYDEYGNEMINNIYKNNNVNLDAHTHLKNITPSSLSGDMGVAKYLSKVYNATPKLVAIGPSNTGLIYNGNISIWSNSSYSYTQAFYFPFLFR